MHRFLFRSLKRRDREGQGLVEYALILVLVAIVVIAIISLFGKTVAQSYCSIVYTLNPKAGYTKACKAPIVVCATPPTGAGYFLLEAQITDPDGDPANPYARISRVEYYVDVQDSTPEVTESSYRYCYPQGNTYPATYPYDSNECGGALLSVISGHTIIAVAYDTDGNTGSCSVRAP